MAILVRAWLLALATSLLAASAWSASAAKPPVNLSIPGDVLPANAQRDFAEAHLEWQGAEWKVVSIDRSTAPKSLRPSFDTFPIEPAVEFVLSDIDSDTDLDVIVLDALASTEKSVWRNDGSGHFRKVDGKRYGQHRFPDGEYHRRAMQQGGARCTAAGWRPTETILSGTSEKALVAVGFDEPATLESLVSPSHLSGPSGRSPPRNR